MSHLPQKNHDMIYLYCMYTPSSSASFLADSSSPNAISKLITFSHVTCSLFHHLVTRWLKQSSTERLLKSFSNPVSWDLKPIFNAMSCQRLANFCKCLRIASMEISAIPVNNPVIVNVLKCSSFILLHYWVENYWHHHLESPFSPPHQVHPPFSAFSNFQSPPQTP